MYDYYNEKKKRNYTGLFVTILTIISLLLVAGLLFGIFTEYLQVKEIGENYTDVFWINFNVKIATQLASFIFVFVIFVVSTLVIRKNILVKNNTLEFLKKTTPILLLSFIISFFASTLIRDTVYTRYLLFANSIPFEQTDPIFGQNIGYYIFERPFLISLIESVSGIWLFQTIYTLVLYVVLYLSNGYRTVTEIIYEKRIMIHNVINIVVYFLMNAATYKFKAEDVLYSTIGEVLGAGYTDIMVWLKYYRVAPILLLVIVVATIVLLFKGKIKHSLAAVAVFPIVWVFVGLISLVVQMLIVQPNEQVVERPYLKHNINFTRTAYNLNNIIEREFPVKNDLTLEDIAANEKTINNIRITDFPATLTVLNQLQGIQNYYRFKDTDIATYDINGTPTAVFTGVRELYQPNLPPEAKTYINTKFRFTHGFGVAMNPVNRVTTQGQPVFKIKNIPPESIEGAPEITQPRIYFGELTNDYVIVNSKQKELDYLEGQKEIEFSYDGKAGIKLGMLNRLIFAINYGDIRMLVSGTITPESKLLLNRNVLQRVERAAPFLTYDDDPYIVITEEGRLKWVVDVYTTSTFYPYSQPTVGNINYIRNSAKAVVDAYDGSVTFYITDTTDPIINVYNRIYPTLFDKEPLPADIEEHVRYPERLFNIQAEIFRRYHMTNPTAFYTNADFWNISKEMYRGEEKTVDPYYNLMKLPGIEEEEELVLMIPYTPLKKNNMVSWLAVRSKGEHYGQMVLYRFPKGINVYGTKQIEDRIDNTPDISREMTLWGQGGSSVIRGNLLVIPIEDSILYVEPVYITAESGTSLPEMKRVIVAYADRIVMEPTLQEALTVLFGTEQPVVTDTGENIQDIVDRTIKAFQDMKDSSQRSDWENFGKYLKRLDDMMNLLEERKTEIAP